MHSYGLPKDIGALHFVGIGGIGMSGIAEVLHALGYEVQGSDQADSANVKRLRDKGMQISIGHAADHLKTKDGSPLACVVVSSAIKPNNPELVAAREQGLPVIRRAEMLAELMRLKWAIAIGGTHGKTTTTSMVGTILESLDPTVINGGIVNAYGTNTRLGKSDIMVVEADESDGTFTRLPATACVVTNMDPEHMEHYGTFENVKAAYRQFIHNLPFYGFAVLCTDHPEVQALIPSVQDRKIITYGRNPQADIRITNIRSSAKGSVFDIEQSTGEGLKDVFLPMLGDHNIQNAAAAIAIALELEVAAPLIKSALENFKGVKRRFTHCGEAGGVKIIDDYAHHPAEIETVLKAARMAVEDTGGKVIGVMQPHRYSRLHDLFEEFCTCFNGADTVVVTDVYEAGESPIEGADKHGLVEGVKSHGHRDARALPKREDLASVIADLAQSGDYVICMGAGDITAIAHALPQQLQEVLDKRKGQVA